MSSRRRCAGRALVLAAVVGVLAPTTTAAGDLSISMRGGRVTVVAHDATVQQILAEWARQGRTRIVNLERVVGAPLTIELKDVPEAKALAIILRSVAGYIAAPRATYDAAVSLYDRILILPTSVAAAAPPGPRPQPTQTLFNVPDPTELANDDSGDPQAPQVLGGSPEPPQFPGAQPQGFPPPPGVAPPAAPPTDASGNPAVYGNPAAYPEAPTGGLAAPGINPQAPGATGQTTSPTPSILPQPTPQPPKP